MPSSTEPSSILRCRGPMSRRRFMQIGLSGFATLSWPGLLRLRAVNAHVFDGLRYRCGAYDQAVSALIEDIHARDLDKRVLVVVSGEFGRTPKISYDRSTGAHPASGAAGTLQPGRDHWPRAFSNIWAGGGIQTGGVIGASDKRGEDVVERACGPGDFLATIYHHLGIDASKITINDFNGRPTALVNEGKPIPELVGRAGQGVFRMKSSRDFCPRTADRYREPDHGADPFGFAASC